MELGDTLLRIGQIANLSGLSSRTIDYYTQRGLLPYKRSSSNYRLFDKNVLHTLERIKLLKQQRLTLAEIEEAIKAANNDKIAPVIQEVKEEIESLQQKIIQLEEVLQDASPKEKEYIYKELTYKVSAITQLLLLL